LGSSAGTRSSDTKKLLSDAEVSLNRLLSHERDALHLASLKRARQNLDDAKKSLQNDLSSADLSLARALKVIEDNLPADDFEEKRLYLVEGIKRFKSAGWTIDATELETRLRNLAAPKTLEPEVPQPTVITDSDIDALILNPSPQGWLELIERRRANQTRMDIMSHINASVYDKGWYRAFLIATLSSALSEADLRSIFGKIDDKYSSDAIQLFNALNDEGFKQYHPASSEQINVDEIVQLLGKKGKMLPSDDSNIRSIEYEFENALGEKIAITREIYREPDMPAKSITYRMSSKREPNKTIQE